MGTWQTVCHSTYLMLYVSYISLMLGKKKKNLKYKSSIGLKVKGWKIIYHPDIYFLKSWSRTGYINIIKLNFRTKNIINNREDNFISIIH